MEVSPSWFLQALSLKMWTFTIVAYFFVFFGFFFSLFFYRKCRKIRENQHSSIGEVFMYMWNFIASQGVASRWSKHVFWKVQVLNISYLQIIVTTAFSTLLVALLSQKNHDVPFHQLDDFLKIRTHSICVFQNFSIYEYFYEQNGFHQLILRQKWKEIVNTPDCDAYRFYYIDVPMEYEKDLCSSTKKIAFVIPETRKENR